MIKTILSLFILGTLAFGLNIHADDQYTTDPKTTTTKVKGNVNISARLVDEALLARDKMAKVDVDVTGIKLASDHKGMTHGGAHLHYQIDNGPIIVTPETSLSFAGLTAGSHTIRVTLVDAKHSPLSAEKTIQVTIP